MAVWRVNRVLYYIISGVFQHGDVFKETLVGGPKNAVALDFLINNM